MPKTSMGELTPEELAARVEGRTLLDLFAANVAELADEVALRQRDGEGWRELSWRQYGDLAARVGAALLARGVQRGEIVCLVIRNRIEHLVADLGCLLIGAVPTSLYLTSSAEQLRALLADSGARIVLVDSAAERDRVGQIRGELPALECVVVIDGAAADSEAVPFAELLQAQPISLDEAVAAASPDDVATVIYTSGTTGVPKAAEHTHRSVVAMVEAVHVCFGADFTRKRLISSLPMAHIGDRGNCYYSGIRNAHVVTCCPDLTELYALVRDVRPHQLFGPPRMWEKLSDGMFGDPSLDIARPEDHASMRARAGIDAIEIAMTGAATLPPHVAERLRAVGIELCDSYGMTEFGPAVGTPRANRPGTSGRPFPGTELRIADDGEIQLRGPAAFRGYRGNPEATAAAFTSDGFVRTGDLGMLDDDGYLSITGRMKDIIIASGGHNVAPAPLENALVSHPLIASAVVVGEGRKYLAALVVLDPVTVPDWARRNGVEGATFAQLAASDALRAEIDRHVAAINERFARVEQVKRTAILTVPWLADSEELTPTMKVRRAVIHAKYHAEIDELYADQ